MQLAQSVAYHYLTVEEFHKMGEVGILYDMLGTSGRRACMQPDYELLDELVRRIVDAVHPRRIILFGSAARGKMGPHSDIDALVVMPDGIHRGKTSREIYRNLWGLGFAEEAKFVAVRP